MKITHALAIIGSVFIVHLIALYTPVYDLWKNFDMVMHFAGGASIGLLAVALLRLSGNRNSKGWFSFLFIVGLSMTVGVLWEFAEFFLEVTMIDRINWVPLTLKDTLSDLFFDGLGASCVWFIYQNKHN